MPLDSLSDQIYTVMPNAKRHTTNIDNPTKNRQKSQRFVKLKEV
jgi:hypothetical protein